MGTGPDHARSFTATVVVADTDYGTGTGPAKKVAEQEAAENAYGRLLAEEPAAADRPGA